jgi:WD40 repeat protein
VLARLETRVPEMLPALITVSDIELQVKSMVRSLTIDEESKRIACGTLDGNVFLINTGSDSIDQQIIYNHNNNRVLSLTFVPRKNWLISTSTDKTIHVWDLIQGKTIKILTEKDAVQKVVLTDSDHLIFSNSTDIMVWDLNQIDQDPLVIYSNEMRQPFTSLAYNPVHKLLVATTLGEILTFTLNNDKTGILKSEQFAVKHEAVISRTDFSRDNNWLVTASFDAIMLWDIRDIKQDGADKVLPIVIETDRLTLSLIFDNESRYIIFGDDELLHIYPIDIQMIYTKLRLIMGKRELTDREWRFYVKGDLEKPHGGD